MDIVFFGSLGASLFNIAIKQSLQYKLSFLNFSQFNRDFDNLYTFEEFRAYKSSFLESLNDKLYKNIEKLKPLISSDDYECKKKIWIEIYNLGINNCFLYYCSLVSCILKTIIQSHLNENFKIYAYAQEDDIVDLTSYKKFQIILQELLKIETKNKYIEELTKEFLEDVYLSISSITGLSLTQDINVIEALAKITKNIQSIETSAIEILNSSKFNLAYILMSKMTCSIKSI